MSVDHAPGVLQQPETMASEPVPPSDVRFRRSTEIVLHVGLFPVGVSARIWYIARRLIDNGMVTSWPAVLGQLRLGVTANPGMTAALWLGVVGLPILLVRVLLEAKQARPETYVHRYSAQGNSGTSECCRSSCSCPTCI